MRIEFRLNLQTRDGRGVRNQVHNHFEAAQRTPTPIFCDVAKHPMFNLIPLARAWGKMTDRIGSPIASATDWSATFQRRLRLLLLPPLSAVTKSVSHCG